jgi:hypothetical protein
MKTVFSSNGRLIVLMAVACMSTSLHAADVVNGWSGNTTISSIYSVGDATLFRLAGTNNGCGHQDHWRLNLEDNARGRTKVAILLAAYIAGKAVNLRCENDSVTDFEIYTP